MTPFRLPTRIHFGSNSLKQLPSIVHAYGYQRVLLVTDAGLNATQWPSLALEALNQKSLDVTVVDSIEPNPTYSTVDTIATEARRKEIELVIGLGGGSVIDAGKAVAMLLHNKGSILEYEGKNRFTDGSAPFIAIPTTCGTGSEVTWVSVISHPQEHRKLSIKGDAMFPNEAIVDPELISTLPSSLIAYTGMDAYTHAIEAYTGTCSNPISDALAEKAIVLLDRYLERAFLDAEDIEARTEVMRASTLAGMAFGNADVAGVHCLSESMGGLYNIPHGLANAILLVPVLKAHQLTIQDRLRTLYGYLETNKGLTGSREYGSSAMLDAIQRLTEQLNIPAFSSLAIPEADYSRIAALSVTNNSNSSNPRPMQASDYLDILQALT